MNFFHSKKTQKSNRARTSQRPLFLSPPFIDASLVDGSFKKIVVLPKYVDEDEWLAVNVLVQSECLPLRFFALFKNNYEPYIWTDQNQKKNTKLPAPTYIDYVMTWVQNLVNDENVFPTKAGREFPREFSVIVRSIFKQCFRVFAHIYYQHYEQILHLREEKQFNSLFAHFISFAKEFNLLPDKKELAPLEELITYMENNGRIS
ncbi:12797_t:CDS:2 [Gigaspora margarita]|uniref:12797_t:CDS:1 n=1 Tax=Gigaspora margarita TaxID=4874 RepID=A0ABN7VWC0_GIGMA|nr:12797_t:CDS:2 [Gigaspora margarita]